MNTKILAENTTKSMAMKVDVADINWQKVGGLLPVIVQDHKSAQVLMLGYMNEAALQKTCQEGVVCFYSRTKGRLWVKGETTGHFLHVVDMAKDCDNDSLLILANPVGVTCHTGQTSCFYDLKSIPDGVFLVGLERLIGERKHSAKSDSYTVSLFAQGTKRIAQKVGEEGVEAALAATAGDKDELKAEAADLLYHLIVLLQDANLGLSDVVAVLKKRHFG